MKEQLLSEVHKVVITAMKIIICSNITFQEKEKRNE